MVSISIVTPVWNGEKYISETLESVASQMEFLREHIVIDSCSTDRTPEIVDGFVVQNSKLRRLSGKDSGIYDGMNKGIHASSGDVVGIINADDYYTQGALGRVSAAMEDQSVDYVYSSVCLVEESGTVRGIEFPRDPAVRSLIGRDWRFYTPFPHPTLFVRRRVYEKIGAFDLKYRIAADHDLMGRLISGGFSGRNLGEPLACFRLGGASKAGAGIAEDTAIAISFGVHPFFANLNSLRCRMGQVRRNVFGGW
jgi:glycosyltransferase involved in cell wall biosynthesis